jgi:NTP pyrophosphatase (non-canonical NTP hydrolase)
MSDFNTLAKQILDLRHQMWPKDSTLSKISLNSLVSVIVEELGETRGAIRSFIGRKYSSEKNVDHKDNIRKELGDIYVPLLALTEMVGLTPEECMKEGVKKLTKRLEKFKEEKKLEAKLLEDQIYSWTHSEL